MRKPRVIISFFLLILGAGLVAHFALKTREPEYKGRLLRSWLEEYYKIGCIQGEEPRKDTVTEQIVAITAIGTNALPTLLRWLETKDSVLESKLVEFSRKQSLLPWHPMNNSDRKWMAVCGFEVLGPIAKQAVPALTNLLQDPVTRWSAALSLGMIGPDSRDSVRTLIPWLTNRDSSLRFCSASALAGIGNGAEEAGPVLFAQLSETNELVRNEIEFALGRQRAFPQVVIPMLVKEIETNFKWRRFEPRKIEALGAYGDQAREGVPTLLLILPEYSEEQRRPVLEALKKIDPQAVAKDE